MSLIEEPIDLIRAALAEPVEVKCRGDRILKGTLHAYDAHLNMVLSDVEETVAAGSPNPDGEDQPPVRANREAQTEIVKRHMDLLFVRGDGVILVSTKSS